MSNQCTVQVVYSIYVCVVYFSFEMSLLFLMFLTSGLQACVHLSIG